MWWHSWLHSPVRVTSAMSTAGWARRRTVGAAAIPSGSRAVTRIHPRSTVGASIAGAWQGAGTDQESSVPSPGKAQPVLRLRLTQSVTSALNFLISKGFEGAIQATSAALGHLSDPLWAGRFAFNSARAHMNRAR
jgi:hypothetical protein